MNTYTAVKGEWNIWADEAEHEWWEVALSNNSTKERHLTAGLRTLDEVMNYINERIEA